MDFPPLTLLKKYGQPLDELKEIFTVYYNRYRAMGYSDPETLNKVGESGIYQAMALSKWGQTKQVYSFSKEFVDTLMTAPLDVPFEKSIFERLPFSCFCVKIDDFYGLVDFDNEFIKGGYVGLFPFIKEGIGGFTYQFPYDEVWDGTPNQTIEEGFKCMTIAEEQKRLTRIMFQVVLYLSCSNAVIEENPKQKKIYRPPFSEPKNRYSEVRIWDCGIRYTKETVKQITEDIHIIRGTHKSPRPHWRRGHWHLYRVGKGRKETKLNWVAPSFVGKGDTPVIVREK